MIEIDLKGHNALICGSSQGIGKSIAKQMAEAGAKVTLLARNQQSLTQVLDTLPGDGHSYLVADFQVEGALEQIEKDVRAGNYTILVNNAGGPPPGPLESANWEAIMKAMQMHLHVSHQLVQWTSDAMKAAKYGRIINIISTSVKIPLAGLGISNTVRGAMASWSKTLSMELGVFGITVNNLLPGFMETTRLKQIISNKSNKSGLPEDQVIQGMKSEVPSKRFGHPDEMGAIAVFLASSQSGYINGVSIPVDGGRTGSI
jgi:3-oxoacyl-[acyl-carrier protein] reductase